MSFIISATPDRSNFEMCSDSGNARYSSFPRFTCQAIIALRYHLAYLVPLGRPTQFPKICQETVPSAGLGLEHSSPCLSLVATFDGETLLCFPSLCPHLIVHLACQSDRKAGHCHEDDWECQLKTWPPIISLLLLNISLLASWVWHALGVLKRNTP